MLFFIVRYFTSIRHVNEILETTEKITKGDFKTRLKKTDLFFDVNGYEIIKQNINRMAEELSGVETLRTDFISNVGHELKTPLTVIQNYATLMQDDNLTENQRKEYSKHIIDQTGRLSSLITNIVRLNKLENQKIYPALKEINLTELVCECMINFESAWEEKNLSIDTEIQDEIFVTSKSGEVCPCLMWADAGCFASWVNVVQGLRGNGVPRLEQARVSGSRNYDTKWLGYLCRKGDFLFRGIVIDRAEEASCERRLTR